MCGASVTGRSHITMKLVIVQVLGVLFLGYQGAASHITAGNDDDVGPSSSEVSKVSLKHDTTAISAISRDQL